MPVKTGGGLETMTLVLTGDQAERLRRIRDERRTDARRITLSDVAREIVAAGLESFHDSRDTDSTAIVPNGEAAA